MQTDSYFSNYCREKIRNHPGLDVRNDQWLEEMGDMIVASVEGDCNINPDSYFYGCCRETASKHIGLNFQNGQWLEEMGDMIRAAIADSNREHLFADD